MVSKIYSDNVFTNYSEFTIECNDPDDSQLESGGYLNQNNGLVGCSATERLFFTAEPQHSLIKLEVELHEHEPSVEDSFDEIVQVSFLKSEKDVFICEFSHEKTNLLKIPAGLYGVRYNIEGFDLDYDYENIEEPENDEPFPPYPGQRYLIQFWPISIVEAEKIIKQTSNLANYWHNNRK